MRIFKYHLPQFLFFSMLALFLSSCRKDESKPVFQLTFEHEVAGQDLVLFTQWYDCAAGHKFQVHRLKYYLSNFNFQKADGAEFQTGLVQYVDLEDPATLALVLPDVPEGEYTGMSFIIGLDELTNVNGGLPNTITNINMEWPLPGDQGYHYMKFEGRYDSLGMGPVKYFNLHTGATGGNQNYVQVQLQFDHSIDVSGGNWNIHLMMDLNEWLQNPHVYDFETFGPMIMANQDAQQVLKENGADVFRVKAIDKG